MDKIPLKLILDNNLQFLFLFSNADRFYLSSRYSLQHGWVVPGCSGAHQAVELYIKAILKLNHEEERGHNIVDLLKKYENHDAYFSKLLQNKKLINLLSELSEAYLLFRYGEAGAESNSIEIIDCLDEISFNLRSVYLRNIKSPSQKMYVDEDAKHDFLKNNKYFSEKDVTSNPLAQFGLPI